MAISKSGYVLSDFRQNDHRMSVREKITFFSGTLRICSLPGGLLDRVFWQVLYHGQHKLHNLVIPFPGCSFMSFDSPIFGVFSAAF